MLRAFRTKRFVVALSVVAPLAVAGGVLAYFSTTGSGTGNAQVGTSAALTIAGTVPPGAGGIVPGGNPAAVAFSVSNPSSANAYVGTVTMTGVQAF